MNGELKICQDSTYNGRRARQYGFGSRREYAQFVVNRLPAKNGKP
jgi:hypothetical protein